MEQEFPVVCQASIQGKWLQPHTYLGTPTALPKWGCHCQRSCGRAGVGNKTMQGGGSHTLARPSHVHWQHGPYRC